MILEDCAFKYAPGAYLTWNIPPDQCICYVLLQDHAEHQVT